MSHFPNSISTLRLDVTFHLFELGSDFYKMKVVDGLHWFTALLYYNSNRLIFSFRLIGSTGRRKITVVTESAAVSAGSSTEKL